MRSHFLLCCSVPNRKHPDCSERMQKNGRCDNSLLTKGRSSIEIQSANEKEVTLSGNHVKGGGSYESPSLYMGMSLSVVQIVPQEDYCRYHMSFMLC